MPILCGDSLEILKRMESNSVDSVVTSPPYYGLRDYGVDGQIGLEKTPQEYVCKLVEIFCEIKRVLKKSGTVWLNLGDSYAGYHGNKNSVIPTSFKRGCNENLRGDKRPQDICLKQKDLIGIPWRVALALQENGYYLRSDIIWNKPNPNPERVIDRPSRCHEYIFLLTKDCQYFYDMDSIRQPLASSSIARLKQDIKNQKGSERGHGGQKNNGNMKAVGSLEGRNTRTVWTVNVNKNRKNKHYATYPTELIEPCIKAGCPIGGVVLDPFCGTGTTGEVALSLGRDFIGIDINPEYCEITKNRLAALPL